MMRNRRDYLPLQGGYSRPASVWNSSPCVSAFLGVICGIAIGSIFAVSVFSWLPQPSSPMIPHGMPEEVNGQQPLPRVTLNDVLPDVRLSRDTEDPFQVKSPDTLSAGNVDRKDLPNPLIKMPGDTQGVQFDKQHEGDRLLTEYEKKGGWRLTPEILEIAKRHPKAKVLSDSNPLAVLFQNFLSIEETEHLVGIAEQHLSRSKVVSKNADGLSNVRTSLGAWLSGPRRDDLVREVEKRIHDAVGVPHSFGEGMYVLRYTQDQKYDAHTDNCKRQGEQVREECVRFLKRGGGPDCGEGHGGATCGDRVATFIIYLRAPEAGGETVFPQSAISERNFKESNRPPSTRHGDNHTWYCNDSRTFKLAPTAGDGILFWDYIPRPDIVDHATYVRTGSYMNNTADTEAINDKGSLHGGCPVLEGQKWIVTRWIRSATFV